MLGLTCSVFDLAGITNGLDMVAAFIRQRWPGAVADIVCALADVGERKQEYENSKAAETSWWIWTLLRAWLGGRTKQTSK